MDLFIPRCSIWHFLQLDLVRPMSAQFSSLYWSLWVAAQFCGESATPLIFVSAAKFVPLVRSLMKKLKRTGCSIDSWSTPLVGPGKADSMTNIFLWSLPLIQFYVHLTVYSSSLYFIHFFIMILGKILQKAFACQCREYTLLTPHLQDSHFTLEV